MIKTKRVLVILLKPLINSLWLFTGIVKFPKESFDIIFKSKNYASNDKCE
jgi:hypothetical protein